MSLKPEPRGLAESDPLAAVKAWWVRGPAAPGSLLYNVTNPHYRGAATGAAVAGVTLGLLMLFVPGSAPQHVNGTPLGATLPHQASSGSAAPGQAGRASQHHPGQHHSGQTSVDAAPGQVRASAWTTPAPGRVGWVYPTPAGRGTSPSVSSSVSPSPAPTLSLPGQPLPSPTLSLPGQPLPSPSPTQSVPDSPSPSSS